MAIFVEIDFSVDILIIGDINWLIDDETSTSDWDFDLIVRSPVEWSIS